ncbi:MAG: rhomboid family intramembrane serine protease [Alphaproteobacteria bacterium]|nr:MAG: rhomboid family intramembrane serine protease [Alphaproteobacteria bacterium]
MILVPISDDNDEGHSHHHHDFIHYGLIFICIAITVYEGWLYGAHGVGALKLFIDQWSFEPRRLGDNFLRAPLWERCLILAKYLSHLENMGLVKMLAATFLHAGFAHLFGNMLVLWMLGDNVEYAMGHIRYLLFFLIAGILSNCGEVVLSTVANFRGGIGASGAVMAVAGAYLFYFPKAKINFFYFILIFWWGVFAVSARVVIGIYFLLQGAEAWLGYGSDYGMVAVWAHVSGFLFGLLMAWPLRKNRKEALYQPHARKAYAKSLATAMRERREHDGHHDHWG